MTPLLHRAAIIKIDLQKNPIKVRVLVDRNKLSERCYSVSVVLIMLKNPSLEVAPTTLV